MPVFEPPDLERRLMEACAHFHKFLGEESGSLFDTDLVRPSNGDTEDKSSLIGLESPLYIRLPYCGEHELTCAEFLTLVDELDGAAMEDNLECWTKRGLLLRICPTFDHTAHFFENILGMNSRETCVSQGPLFPVELAVEGTPCRCSIRRGLTVFGVLIAAGDDYDKYFPPVLDDELFVEIRFEGPIDRQLTRNVAYSYLFEVSTSLQVDLVTDTRPVLFTGGNDQLRIEAAHVFRARPLMIGRGITEVIRLYDNAVKSSMCDVQFLQFYKVIEHVSRTVVHQSLIHATRAKLLSASALSASAAFIMELQSLFEQNRIFTKDREAVKLTFKICCEVTELVKVAPNFLREKLSTSPDSLNVAKPKDRHDILEKIGECVVATRNALAHAKTAYTLTGDECPHEQLPQLVECAKVAAQQIIRWYDSQPEELRIV